MSAEIENRPGPARVSGWMWLVFSGFMFLGWIATIAMASGDAWIIATVQVIPAVVIFHIGLQTIRARAKDTLGNGIGSILIGFVSFGQVPKSSGSGEGLMILLIALYLMLAGILALVGRQQYKKWHGHRNSVMQLQPNEPSKE